MNSIINSTVHMLQVDLATFDKRVSPIYKMYRKEPDG